MSVIMDIVEALASGKITLNQARESIRQVKPPPYATSGGWVLDSAYEPDGGIVELHAAAMVYDLTADEHEALRQSLNSLPIGDASQVVDLSSPGEKENGARPGSDPSGSGPISLDELLAPDPEDDGTERVLNPEPGIPHEDDNPPIFGEKDWNPSPTPSEDKKNLKKSLWESIFKHLPGRHPQERHSGDNLKVFPPYLGGSNQDTKPTEDRTHLDEKHVYGRSSPFPRRHSDLADRWVRAKAKARLSHQSDVAGYLASRFSASELKTISRYASSVDVDYVEDALARLRKHYPGGEDHPQERHGDREGAGAGDGGDEKSSAPVDNRPQHIKDLSPQAQALLPPELQPPKPPPPSRQVGTDTSGTGRRPKTFDAIRGQDNAVARLRDIVNGSKALGEQVPHVLFTGPAGLGKTTLALTLANEMGVQAHVITGPNLKSIDKLARELGKLQDGDVLFIDEIHAIPKDVQEILYPAMEDFEMDYETKDGFKRVQLPKFTLVGATTDPQGLLHPLKERFTGGDVELQFLENQDLAEVVKGSAKKDGFGVPDDIALDIAGRARGVPRAANRIYDRARTTAAAMGFNSITPEALKRTYQTMEIDSAGLTEDDREVLRALADQSGPVGLNTLSTMAVQPMVKVRDNVEPFLLRMGFIQRTPSGRIITEKGRQHLQSVDFSKSVRIVKTDPAKNMIFGWANVAFTQDGQVEDHQGHLIDVDDLESGAYNFVLKYRSSGDEHTDESFGELVESVVVTPEKIEKGGFPPDMLGKWWVGFKLPPEHWEKVRNGDRSMFSIQGKARLEPLD